MNVIDKSKRRSFEDANKKGYRGGAIIVEDLTNSGFNPIKTGSVETEGGVNATNEINY